MQSEETGALKLASMSLQDENQAISQKHSGPLLAAISNLVVRIYAEHVGRGPTRARTYFNDNVIVCVLHDTLIKPSAPCSATASTRRC
jgi:Na+-translocating membrane potential-generating system (MpsC)